MVHGHSRWLWGRFCATQDLQTVMRCHIDVFAAMGGAPQELFYDRMKTAVINEDTGGVMTSNASRVALLNHYGALPRACRPYERGAMILTSNRGFAKWGEMFGDPVVATALLDRLRRRRDRGLHATCWWNHGARSAATRAVTTPGSTAPVTTMRLPPISGSI
ncbi:hypothetical protein D2T29_13550 [Sinirhodobacter populi]|uniref:IstB-like ATP-binding domain-containing protein n=1 Tax=Paenirhodobacter populi TaxID=2306993 RepID=A0A443KAH3_9RHOB|nr:hypothetical protein D2T29_13550 [Sinirhodobacter populi]